MPKSIESILAEYGPSISSRVVDMLSGNGLTRTAARQQISRSISRGDVKRLRGINFPNQEAFLFLAGQFGNKTFRDNLVEALISTGSSYGRALLGLKARGGAVLSSEFSTASGLPIARAKGQVQHDFVESKLLELGLIIKSDTPDGCVIGLQDENLISKHRRATLVVEDILLSALKSWLMRVGWTSSGTPKIRSAGAPQFGQFRWDLVAPSFLHGLRTYKDKKLVNGFIVADIILESEITIDNLRTFFSKCDVLIHQRRATRFQPMFIANSFSPEALHELRSRGYFIGRPETLFGEDIAKSLSELVSIIENAAGAITHNPTAVFDLVGKIAKLEGASLNLRGVVIELLVAHLFQLQGYRIDIRQQIRSKENEPAEIDIKATNRQEVVCVECKGKSPGILVDASEIQEWLDKPLIRIKSWLKLTTTLPQKRRFEFYASTGYTDDAKTLIHHIKMTHTKQPIEFLEGRDVLNKLHAQKESALTNIFREQFMSI